MSKKNKNTIAFDIDNTLCSPLGHNRKIQKPYRYMIQCVNDLYRDGYTILLFTARKSKDKQKTLNWLKKHKVKYNRIIFNKPEYLLLVDDRSYPPYSFVNSKIIESYINHINTWDFNKSSPFNK